MPPFIEQHRQAIVALCQRYGVKRLELFGSAARGDFDPAESDVDFLVLFVRPRTMDAAEQFLGLAENLKRVLGREIDLVDIDAARNPYFIADALKNRVMLYAA